MKTAGRLINVLRLVRDVAFWWLDGFAVLGARRSQSSAMVCVRVDAIGDFVLWFGAFQVMRNHFRERPFFLICSETVAELARSYGEFDEVIGIDLNAFIARPLYRWRIVRKVRKVGAGIAVQPTVSRSFLTGDSLIRATGAPKRIGSTGDLTNAGRWQRWLADRWYSQLIPAGARSLTELERNFEFLQGLGIRHSGPRVSRLPRLAGSSSCRGLSGHYFVVFPGASRADRMWPAERFGEVARHVTQSYGWQLVVCGTASERQRADIVIEQSPGVDALNLAGRTSLPEFVEIVRGARLLIGNETSAVHIAAAVGTPCVCILGGGHFERFLPYPDSVAGTKPVAVFESMDCFGCNWRCLKRYSAGSAVPCISRIEASAVLPAVDEALRGEQALAEAD